MRHYLKIPVELITYCFQKRLIRPLQLYVYLKYSYSGKIRLSDKDLKLIGKKIGLTSLRGVKNNLKRLRALNWIGYNPKSGYYFVRSLDQVRKFLNLENRTAAVFNEDITKFKAFCISAVIGYLIKNQRAKASERIWGRRSNQNAAARFYPISCISLSKILNIDKSTAFRYKQLARDAGFINIKPDYDFLTDKVRDFDFLKTIDERLKLSDAIYIQKPDLIENFIFFKKRKKLQPS